MSVAEIKKSILEKVETLSEEQLIELNHFVHTINSAPVGEYDLIQHVENIVREREEVMKKLAQ